MNRRDRVMGPERFEGERPTHVCDDTTRIGDKLLGHLGNVHIGNAQQDQGRTGCGITPRVVAGEQLDHPTSTRQCGGKGRAGPPGADHPHDRPGRPQRVIKLVG